ncbi:hypothetical protein O181_029876 [Austropuccinia psidii MF-1]|uniref:Uncharacterized protein n=1 Tax=Austropuccinia psidii MF-1 TaxID=1389203 RepID=A0A9Q3CXC8_9BASI|nr:hypothetical protein [Austropuccinia psidii MF-1]
MCQHCSTQTHSCPEGHRHGVAFTSFQYEQHIKKLRSAIEPNAIPNIPPLESESEHLKILLDQIFPKHALHSTGSQFNGTEIILQESKASPTRPWNDNICHSILKV